MKFISDINIETLILCTYIIPPIDRLLLNSKELNKMIKIHPNINISTKQNAKKTGNINLPCLVLADLNINYKNKDSFNKLHQFIKNFSGRIVFSTKNETCCKILKEILKRIEINPIFIKTLNEVNISGFYITINVSEHSFINYDQKIVVICESEILDKRIINNDIIKNNTINTNIFINNLTDLQINEPVVHIEHGIGRFQGLTILETGGLKAEYLILTYADDDKLYIPISSLNLINRYNGIGNENVPLHKLGNEVWGKVKKKAAEKISDIAAELLDVHAQRNIKFSFAFKHDKIKYKIFCQDFPFKTTIDQEKAINDVLNDMCKPIAMDRLICGDVGFGKTEVAMRAAFLAVSNNQQVVMLVPTTLLAQQHFNNFRTRFSNWPVCIEMLSRFCSVKEQRLIINKVSEGKIGILIGTHKILQNNIHWKALGLLIIDEEHRFGVKQKELIKSIRVNIDVLTLTATPIPRTINIAMNGIRDLSIISTPPPCRLSVKTFIYQYDDLIVRKAILYEISRGGQVYYLFNNVKYIEKTKERLELLVPEARFIIGHGQMRERDLEHVMSDFYNQHFNVLICTTIIETGIDIPSVNTIIIERADHFGLAQLHQLRGRVGRSYHQSYAYFLTPNPKIMTTDAQKKLKAIAVLGDLGVGLSLAIHDLEIRGAGELLGQEQSGQMVNIGFQLYMELLENAVKALNKGNKPSLEELISRQQTQIELKMPVLLPDNYIPDVNVRLYFYKKIASVKHENELNELKMELIDRFGKLPDTGIQLLQSTAIRIQAEELNIKRIEAHEKGGFIKFNKQNRININFIITLLKNSPDIYRLDGPYKLKFVKPLIKYAERLTFIKQLIDDFKLHQI
ncbi:MAG: transcription-repair coupling factor [Arsenophonus sp.]